MRGFDDICCGFHVIACTVIVPVMPNDNRKTSKVIFSREDEGKRLEVLAKSNILHDKKKPSHLRYIFASLCTV